MDTSIRILVIRRAGKYSVWYQPYNDALFIHCDVYAKWTKTLKRELQRDFEQLISLSDQPLYVLAHLEDTKHHKFLRMFGFEQAHTVPYGNDEMKYLFIH